LDDEKIPNAGHTDISSVSPRNAGSS